MRESVDPATVVGRGKLDEIRAEALAHQAPLVVFDGNLTPVQQRNLERGMDCRVIDRTQLILDIFARHARSREGQLQVELAQLNYLLPRLAGSESQLSRLGGGIGTRGPGEQKLETDRRRIRERVRRIGQTIETLRKQRALRRQARQAVPLGTVALVGYTNAGKSTLFNALSRADVLVSPKMFATLDPTVRAVRLPSNRRAPFFRHRRIHSRLAKGITGCFSRHARRSATGVSHSARQRHFESAACRTGCRSGKGVCASWAWRTGPRIHVFNKIDRLAPDELAALARSQRKRLCIGAHWRADCAELLRARRPSDARRSRVAFALFRPAGRRPNARAGARPRPRVAQRSPRCRRWNSKRTCRSRWRAACSFRSGAFDDALRRRYRMATVMRNRLAGPVVGHNGGICSVSAA